LTEIHNPWIIIFMRIVVCGSSGIENREVEHAATNLGTEIGKRKHDVLVGEGAEVPYTVARAAHQQGSTVTAYSPFAQSSLHHPTVQRYIQKHDCDPSGIISNTVYFPEGLKKIGGQVRVKMRNMMLVGAGDAAVIVSGSWGTVTEFGMARSCDMPIGLLKGTKGAADALEEFVMNVERTREPKNLVYTNDPVVLLRQLEELLEMQELLRD
jgi:predicted Rossmann-fold nucleotide-binding protein